MKAEDAERLWCLATAVNGCSLAPLPEQLADLVKFARACEQHGIGRAKVGARATCCHECGECGGEGYVDDEEVDGDDDCPQCEGKGERIDEVAIDWSALDAEIEKENEDG